MRFIVRKAKLFSVASLISVVVSSIGYSSTSNAGSISGLGWLGEAQRAVAAPVQGTPPIPSEIGPATTPGFEAINSALVRTGTQTFSVVDFSTQGLYPLGLVRTAGRTPLGLFGTGWSSNLNPYLLFTQSGGSVTAVKAYRGDGSVIEYNRGASDYRNSSPGADSWVTKEAGSYSLRFKSGAVETYDLNGRVVSEKDATGIGLVFNRDSAGKLLSVQHSNGQALTVGYSGSVVSWIRDPAGNQYNFSYNSNAVLIGVAWPNGDTQTYTYDGGPYALSGVFVNGTRYKTISYDSNGRAYQTGFGDGSINRSTLTYGSNVTTVTSSTGGRRPTAIRQSPASPN